MVRRVLTCVLVLLGILGDSAAFSQGQGYVPDQIVVKFRPRLSLSARMARHRACRGVVRERIAPLNMEVVTVPPGTAAEKAAAYRSDPNVLSAEPNYICAATAISNDPYSGNQWGLSKILAPQAWSMCTGGGVWVAMLDTGIDQQHPDLAPKIIANKNFSSSYTYDDLAGHGTHTAGIAAAITNNGSGVAGTCPDCMLMNVKILGDDGTGTYSSMINGIIWATDNGAQVISMSLGGSGDSQSLRDAVHYAWSHGVVVVAAAGNNGSSAPCYPAYIPECISVAATDSNDNKAGFSDWGSWVSVAAPGVSILSTMPTHPNRLQGSNYGYMSGTSMAAPFVAGLAGLLWSQWPYNSSNSAIRQRIESTCDPIPGTGTYWVHGRINASRAVH